MSGDEESHTGDGKVDVHSDAVFPDDIKSALRSAGWEPCGADDLSTFTDEYIRLGRARGSNSRSTFDELVEEFAGFGMLKRSAAFECSRKEGKYSAPLDDEDLSVLTKGATELFAFH